MPNPVTDYQLSCPQGDLEALTRYIARLNPGIPYLDAYTKAVRVMGRASGQERSRLR